VLNGHRDLLRLLGAKVVEVFKKLISILFYRNHNYVLHTLERDKMLDIVPLKTYLYSKLRFHGSNTEEPSLGISMFSRDFGSVLTQVPKKLLPRILVL
jgi:hypothetical protein